MNELKIKPCIGTGSFSFFMFSVFIKHNILKSLQLLYFGPYSVLHAIFTSTKPYNKYCLYSKWKGQYLFVAFLDISIFNNINISAPAALSGLRYARCSQQIYCSCTISFPDTRAKSSLLFTFEMISPILIIYKCCEPSLMRLWYDR